jgi:hypothetical protein
MGWVDRLNLSGRLLGFHLSQQRCYLIVRKILNIIQDAHVALLFASFLNLGDNG